MENAIAELKRCPGGAAWVEAVQQQGPWPSSVNMCKDWCSFGDSIAKDAKLFRFTWNNHRLSALIKKSGKALGVWRHFHPESAAWLILNRFGPPAKNLRGDALQQWLRPIPVWCHPHPYGTGGYANNVRTDSSDAISSRTVATHFSYHPSGHASGSTSIAAIPPLPPPPPPPQPQPVTAHAPAMARPRTEANGFHQGSKVSSAAPGNDDYSYYSEDSSDDQSDPVGQDIQAESKQVRGAAIPEKPLPKVKKEKHEKSVGTGTTQSFATALPENDLLSVKIEKADWD